MMRQIRPSFGVLAIVALVSLETQSTRTQSDDAKRLIGTWRVVSITQPNGQPARGLHPAGLIYYDASGHMAAQIMTDPSLRRSFKGAQPSPEEAQAALREYNAYFGTYSVNERARRITHHRQGGLTPGVLADVVRAYEFVTDDQLVLTVTDGSQNRLLWERVR
jgi:hypothetical protein